MIRIDRRLVHALLIATALAPCAHPQTTPAAALPATNPAPDFSQGFAALHRLGVTNVSRAAFVSFFGSGSYQMVGNFPFEANAPRRFGWQLSGDASNGVFLLGDGLTLRRASTAAPQLESGPHFPAGTDDETEWELLAATQTIRGVTWKEADLDTELTRVTEKLRKELAKRETAPDDADPFASRVRHYSSGGQSLAPVLFFATHAADKGRTNAANLLAALAMNLAGDRQKLIESAVNELAGRAYGDAWQRFRGSGDWSVYADEVAALTARFPRGWRNAAQAAEVLRRVRAFNAAGRKPAALPGEIPPADRALADALVSAPHRGYANQALMYRRYWVLPQDTNETLGAWIATNAHPVARLLRGGTNSIPLLLALLDDTTTLTSFVSYRPLGDAAPDANADDDEIAMMMQMEMMSGGRGGFSHPAARAEIAAMLLEPIVGQQEAINPFARGRSAPAARKPLAEQVREWQTAHAGLNPEELAVRLLASQDYNANNQAADFLARSASTSAWQRLEQHILRNRYPDNLSHVAEKYVRRRGKEARPFVEAYARRLSGGAPVAEASSEEDADPDLFKSGGSSDESDKYRRKNAERIVARLRRIVENKPAIAIFDEIAADRRTLADAREELQELWQEPPQETLNALIGSTARATNSATRVELLGVVNWILLMNPYRMSNRHAAAGMDGGEPAGAQALSPLPAADAWRQLLADARVPTHAAPSDWISEPTVRLQAAMAMEQLCSPGVSRDLPQMVNRLGVPVQEILLQRAASRLSGAADVQPPLPDAGRVPAARLLALTNSAPSAAALAALTADERYALALAVRDTPVLAPKLAPAAHRCRGGAALDIVASGAMASVEGQVLSRALIQTLVTQCEAAAKRGRPVMFELRRQSGFRGIELSVRNARPDELPPASPDGGVVVRMATTEGLDERLTCRPGKAAVKPAAVEDPTRKPTDEELLAAAVARLERGPLSPAEVEEAFWKRADAFCAGDESIGFQAVVTITAVPTP